MYFLRGELYTSTLIPAAMCFFRGLSSFSPKGRRILRRICGILDRDAALGRRQGRSIVHTVTSGRFRQGLWLSDTGLYRKTLKIYIPKGFDAHVLSLGSNTIFLNSESLGFTPKQRRHLSYRPPGHRSAEVPAHIHACP